MILKSTVNVLSPRGTRGRLSILIFHRVLAQPDPIFPGEQDVRRFSEVLSWIGRWFNVMPLDQALSLLGTDALPARAASITFDDGYADNATHALPVLQHHRMSATFYVATSFLDGGRMWNDSVVESIRSCRAKELDLTNGGFGKHVLGSVEQRRSAIESLLHQIKYLTPEKRLESVEYVMRCAQSDLPQDLMMTSRQVQQLHAAGMQIGAHTCSHPILATLTDESAMREIKDSKTTLETLVGDEISLFAYPNGKPGTDYLPKHAKMVEQAGFKSAVTTARGVSSRTTDRYQLPRFSPWDTSRWRYGVRMLANLRNVPG